MLVLIPCRPPVVPVVRLVRCTNSYGKRRAIPAITFAPKPQAHPARHRLGGPVCIGRPEDLPSCVLTRMQHCGYGWIHRRRVWCCIPRRAMDLVYERGLCGQALPRLSLRVRTAAMRWMLSLSVLFLPLLAWGHHTTGTSLIC